MNIKVEVRDNEGNLLDKRVSESFEEARRKLEKVERWYFNEYLDRFGETSVPDELVDQEIDRNIEEKHVKEYLSEQTIDPDLAEVIAETATSVAEAEEMVHKAEIKADQAFEAMREDFGELEKSFIDISKLR